MTYEEIIAQNYLNKWWAEFAFHYTDMSNAVNILRDGCLYSRIDAEMYGNMSNDNASMQVINMTNSDIESYVRMYFRPHTPTQYHNEGYKHVRLRYCRDQEANVPVPVFFLFDLASVLEKKGTMFSEKSLAGFGDQLQNGVEAFANLNFQQIYKTGYMENPNLEKKYRQAEIVYPGEFPIEDTLCCIVCRNDIERQSLLNKLRCVDYNLFVKYRNRIKVDRSCFECNGLFIEQCNYYGDKIGVVYSDTKDKKYYIRRYKDGDEQLLVRAHAEFIWKRSEQVIFRQYCDFAIDYENPRSTQFSGMVKPEGATALYMEISFENKSMCLVCWQLAESAML